MHMCSIQNICELKLDIKFGHRTRMSFMDFFENCYKALLSLCFFPFDGWLKLLRRILLLQKIYSFVWAWDRRLWTMTKYLKCHDSFAVTIQYRNTRLISLLCYREPHFTGLLHLTTRNVWIFWSNTESTSLSPMRNAKRLFTGPQITMTLRPCIPWLLCWSVHFYTWCPSTILAKYRSSRC